MKMQPAQILVWLCRIALGVIFIAASWHKILDPDSFARSIYNYQVLPATWINGLAIFLPWLELVAGLALILVPALRRGANLLILVLLIAFTSAIALNLYRGVDISCGCFSKDGKGQRIGSQKIAENSGMIAASAFLLFAEARRRKTPTA